MPSSSLTRSAVEFIPDKLYFLVIRTGRRILRDTSDSHFIETERDLIYEPFVCDFGPLNISCTVKFSKKIEQELAKPQNRHKRIYYCCDSNPHNIANSALLISSYMLMVHGQSPDEAYRPLMDLKHSFVPFRDASSGMSCFNLTILDCLRGLQKAISLGWVRWREFDTRTYDRLAQVVEGDLNWLIPRKICAFSSPISPEFMHRHPHEYFLPVGFYIPLFHELGIRSVVRLNQELYRAETFTKEGMDHHELFFVDGSLPTVPIINEFLRIVETARGPVAVHCKAGLGRTGTLVSIYLIAKYGFTAREAIAWLRLARPGSVIGQQQNFLARNYDLFSKVDLSSLTTPPSAPASPITPSARGSYRRTPEREARTVSIDRALGSLSVDRTIAEPGQASYLLRGKIRNLGLRSRAPQ